MDRLKNIASFALITAMIFIALRLIHVGIPIFYPKVLAGPFSLDNIAEVENYTGFSPRLPFYRPEELGRRPVYVTVARRPYPRAVIFWQGDHFLYLAQQRGGPLPEQWALGEPLRGRPGTSYVLEGRTHTLVMKVAELTVEVRTDLSLQDVERIIDTLRPYDELL